MREVRFVFFFFKQKTVYDMRISDCSSDVCSSDLDRQLHPDASRIILTHTNDEVRQLNEDVRDRLRAGGALGEDVAIKIERGERMFAEGDRVMFLRNERELGVKNGSLGTEIGSASGRGSGGKDV